MSVVLSLNYAFQVKKVLSLENYKLFSKTLGNYKKTGNFTEMVTFLADIFTDHPNNYHLFRSKWKLIRNGTEHKTLINIM